jgi:hypothetical protein
VFVSKDGEGEILKLTLVCGMNHLPKIAIEDFDHTKLFLFIFEYGLRRNQLLRHPTSYEHVVLLGYLDATLLQVKLTDANAISRLFEIELFGLVLCELDHVKPCNIGIATVRFEDTWGTFEKSFESLEEDRTDRTGAQIPSQALVSLENAIVFSDQSQ